MEELPVVEKTYRVPDISCEHCVRAISGELARIDGLEVVMVDLATKVVTVRHDDRVTEDEIISGIEDAGYEVAAE
jgi:copper ion binding protein